MLIRLFSILAVCMLPLAGMAQGQWPSPEVEQMYHNAREQMMSGNLKQAIITYRQAIQLAPDKMILYRDLAHAQYLSSEIDAALLTLDPILKSGEADDQAYQTAAACYLAKNEGKKAKTMLQEAVRRYPHSGLLYNQLAKQQEQEGDNEGALSTWLTGIQQDPAYHISYYEAARMYMGTTKPHWAVIYAEVFLNIEQHTPRAEETKDMLLGAYMRMYDRMGQATVPKYKGATTTNPAASGFETAVYNTYLKLSPVVSDGITAENLIMLRTRFLMEWQRSYSRRYPFSMFVRMDDMLRNGYFDIYNQWVFGQIDNPQQFEAWTKFHGDAMPKIEEWLKQHPYRPTAGDFYNDKNIKGIFIQTEATDGKKKKK
ncbi:hypothetical protein CAP35_13600 [Chitinophagaceae bacterium IBVUCB1]|nr:hypothetical protein CAP35_13600 [Chitinophagaceae bacterium IBVUCB1]